MVGPLPVIEVSNPCYERGVAIIFRPIDRFLLRFEESEHLRVVLHHVVVNGTSFRTTFRARFDKNVRYLFVLAAVSSTQPLWLLI